MKKKSHHDMWYQQHIHHARWLWRHVKKVVTFFKRENFFQSFSFHEFFLLYENFLSIFFLLSKNCSCQLFPLSFLSFSFSLVLSFQWCIQEFNINYFYAQMMFLALRASFWLLNSIHSFSILMNAIEIYPKVWCKLLRQICSNLYGYWATNVIFCALLRKIHSDTLPYPPQEFLTTPLCSHLAILHFFISFFFHLRCTIWWWGWRHKKKKNCCWIENFMQFLLLCELHLWNMRIMVEMQHAW